MTSTSAIQPTGRATRVLRAARRGLRIDLGDTRRDLGGALRRRASWRDPRFRHVGDGVLLGSRARCHGFHDRLGPERRGNRGGLRGLLHSSRGNLDTRQATSPARRDLRGVASEGLHSAAMFPYGLSRSQHGLGRPEIGSTLNRYRLACVVHSCATKPTKPSVTNFRFGAGQPGQTGA